jgi:hypothetical protein
MQSAECRFKKLLDDPEHLVILQSAFDTLQFNPKKIDVVARFIPTAIGLGVCGRG